MDKRIIIVISFLVIAVSILIIKSSSNEKEYQKILIEKMYDINKNGIILDVRTEEEYNEGHIDGSLHIPIDNILSVTTEIKNKDIQIFVYCKSGVRSKKAANELINLGYTNVYDIGGIDNQNVNLVK